MRHEKPGLARWITPKTSLILEGIGFLLLVALIWVDEVFDVPHRILGAPPVGSELRIEEAIAEAAVVVVVGVVVFALTRWSAKRIAYLESLVAVCAWCHRVRLDDAWVPVDQFVNGRGAQTTHGICPDCTRQFEDSPRTAGAGPPP